jgi:two-component system CheB/CheR fusion protein
VSTIAKTTVKPNSRTSSRSKHPRPFPIVGIGASAGGLEAFTELLKHLPADTGMGIVLVQHLDPVHESELARLLARATTMPTREVTNNLRAGPNQVYVIPPNANMSNAKGVLKLEARAEGRKPQYGIDRFFESLAQDQRERAIGVVLSGAATDGTLGLEAIKAEGGIAFARDDSAKYHSMPRSAVAAGCVDFVLSPMDIATELARIAQHPFVVGSKDEPAASRTSEKHSRDAGERERETSTTHQNGATALPSGGQGSPAVGAKRARTEMGRASPQSANAGIKKILLLLRNHCGVDFSFYKSTTIQRRIARRMVLGKRRRRLFQSTVDGLPGPFARRDQGLGLDRSDPSRRRRREHSRLEELGCHWRAASSGASRPPRRWRLSLAHQSRHGIEGCRRPGADVGWLEYRYSRCQGSRPAQG